VPLSFTVLPDGSGLVCPYPILRGLRAPAPATWAGMTAGSLDAGIPALPATFSG
jgi:hypothetical protein